MAVAPHLHRLYALEPDGRTFRRLTAFSMGTGGVVRPIFAAAWSCDTSLSFAAKGGRSAAASKGAKAVTVQARALDRLPIGERIDYIKYDVEGAEREALLGSRTLLLRDAPELQIALYHRSEDLFALPLLVHSICPDYRFYLRRYPCYPAWDLNLIATKK